LEFDRKLKVFISAKPLLAGLTYPYDWGFIPSTKADERDPIDVLITPRHTPVSFFDAPPSAFSKCSGKLLSPILPAPAS
jgi:inorganic pyrophosphatase